MKSFSPASTDRDRLGSTFGMTMVIFQKLSLWLGIDLSCASGTDSGYIIKIQDGCGQEEPDELLLLLMENYRNLKDLLISCV